MGFDTAWDPADEFVKHLGKMFPLLDFTLLYGEAGNDTSGIVKMEQGVLVQEEEGYFGDFYGERDNGEFGWAIPNPKKQ